MYQSTSKHRIRFGRIFDSLRFNWTRRRYLWRASLYYNVVSWILVIGIIFTFVFHFLISRYSFFVNYSCSQRSMSIIIGFMISIIITTGILLLLSIFLARMCNMFSNYAMGHFMNTKKWLDWMGCTVKWLPWVSALLMWAWFAIQFTSLIWVFASPKQWCENRFDEKAVTAVKNCRLIINKNIPCQIVLPNQDRKEIRNCNNPDYLIRKKMVLLAQGDSETPCSVEDISVCNAYRDAIEKDDYKWDEVALPGCFGEIPSDMNNFMDYKNSSDLYKYILLFTIGWSVSLVVIVFFFYFIKSVTKFDAIIYQPKDPSDNIIVKIIRPFTPWTN